MCLELSAERRNQGACNLLFAADFTFLISKKKNTQDVIILNCLYTYTFYTTHTVSVFFRSQKHISHSRYLINGKLSYCFYLYLWPCFFILGNTVSDVMASCGEISQGCVCLHVKCLLFLPQSVQNLKVLINSGTNPNCEFYRNYSCGS